VKISGSNVVPYPVERVWDAILDPQVLVATIPGCSRLDTTGEHEYAMTVTAGVASIKGTYNGTCSLGSLVPGQSLVMKLSGSGAPGTVDATVDVTFADLGESGTEISYAADATVGGMVGGVGQRMLTSVSKRMAGEFFANVGKAIDAPPAAASSAPAASEPGAPAAPATSFTPPARVAAAGSPDDFLKGVAVGAGLVLLGVLAGSLASRRR
jgi:uncharacterized protein